MNSPFTHSLFWHCSSLKMYFLDCSPSVSCTSSVRVTFSSFSPLCFLYSMSSPPIWPGSPFYRKNKGVLLQGRVACLTVFTCCEPSLLSLMCFWFYWQVLFIFFYPHQFYHKKESWLICMLFRWAFPSTKGTHSCTWLAPTGISWVGVYLVCLPWFKKSCFKSETDFLHLFSMWYLDPASLSVVTSLSHSVIPREFFFFFQFWHTSLFPIVEQTEVGSIQGKLNG